MIKCSAYNHVTLCDAHLSNVSLFCIYAVYDCITVVY